MLFNNVFIKKENWDYLQYFNYIYWATLITKNVLKWIFAVQMENTNHKAILLIILSVNTLMRLALIGVGNIHQFRKRFKNNLIILFIVFISKCPQLLND